MPTPLVPYRARYAFVRPDGSEAGTEELDVTASADGWRIQTRIKTVWPEDVVATVAWDLDRDLTTRLLHIVSRERFSGESELELTVTGNGLLAHRRAVDGPTQVELGWGPSAELDYVSAAFPAVMLRRSGLKPGATRPVDAVQIGTVDLVPSIVPQLLRATEPDDQGDHEPRAGAQTAERVECKVIKTGHLAAATATAEGVLVTYTGLLRLISLEVSK